MVDKREGARAERENENPTSLAPRMMVAICDLSPHSARNVSVKDSKKMADTKFVQNLRPGVRIIPVSKSCCGWFIRTICTKESNLRQKPTIKQSQ
jgi:hypothetical protein